MILALCFAVLSKLYWAFYIDRLIEFMSWINADLLVLLSGELVLAYICYNFPRKAIIRTATIVAAVICTWSVMNAGWLIATGTQILPAVLIPLVRDPLNRLAIVGHHLSLRPIVAIALLGPSAAGLGLLFAILKNPQPPKADQKLFIKKSVLYSLIIIAGFVYSNLLLDVSSKKIIAQGLRFNSQLKAVANIFSHSVWAGGSAAASQMQRSVPTYEQIFVYPEAETTLRPYNIVIVIPEGISYLHTSFGRAEPNLTPFLTELSKSSFEFSNARVPITHTTKALFAILTGRYPSISQDFVEAVVQPKPYASLATILGRNDYRAGFFQSAMGTFEARAGLVHNLGFEDFHAREDLNDANSFVGYLGSDEFAMLEPIERWIQQSPRPFLLTVLCSVSHDPYLVPERFGENPEKPLDRYHNTIRYTDSFIKAMYQQIERLGLSDDTIFCVIGDHGEAFGEHQRFGHDRNPYEEALRIVWVIKPAGADSEHKIIRENCSSIDFTPTILGMLGFDIGGGDFDGSDLLAVSDANREVYFSSWINGPVGFVERNTKTIYDPTNNLLLEYDLGADPKEQHPSALQLDENEHIVNKLVNWRDENFIPMEIPKTRQQRLLFGKWVCRWKNRQPLAERREAPPVEPAG